MNRFKIVRPYIIVLITALCNSVISFILSTQKKLTCFHEKNTYRIHFNIKYYIKFIIKILDAYYRHRQYIRYCNNIIR